MNLQFTEILIVLVVALLVLGPKKLPGMARSIGKGLREMRRATDELKNVWDEEVDRPAREATQLPKILPPDTGKAVEEGWPAKQDAAKEGAAQDAAAVAAKPAPQEAPPEAGAVPYQGAVKPGGRRAPLGEAPGEPADEAGEETPAEPTGAASGEDEPHGG